MSVFRLFLVSLLAACYVPVGPEIYSTHISCHWNDGYEDYMWIFQVWVDHPVHPLEVDGVSAFLHDYDGNIFTIPMEYSNATLWKNIPRQEDTPLNCGEWYFIDFAAVDKYGYHDYNRSNY